MRKIPKDLKQKIFSLLIAISLWYYVIGTENPTVEKEFHNVPVSYKNMSNLTENDLTILGEKDLSVSVKLRGSTNSFINVNSSDVRAEVDLYGYSENSQNLPIRYTVPDGLAIVERSMTSAPIKIEKVLDLEIPVEIVLLGEPADDVIIQNTAIIPETIVVKGPSSLVESIDKAECIVPASEITANTTRNIPVQIVDTGGNVVTGLDSSQAFVNASFKVATIRSLPIELVTTNSLSDGVLEINRELNISEVEVIGTKDLVSKLNRLETQPFDLTKVVSDGEYDVILNLPEGISLANSETKVKVGFRLDKMTTKVYELTASRVELRKVSQGFRGAVINNSQIIDLNLSGLESVINPVSDTVLTLYADLTGLETGEHDVKVQMEAITGITVNELNPEMIKVRITESGPGATNGPQ
ncbi:MAG: CdaR family protein [Tissierellia bacterium]|nr:CdaR family protein [Tissierellia bacterium]